MPTDDSGIQWNPKVPQATIRRLYELDARGIVDAELINEVGFALYARCQSVVLRNGNRVQCPRCDHIFATGWNWHKRYDTLQIRCPQCQAWEITGRQYRTSVERDGIAAWAALAVFESFVERYPGARTSRERMILIDRVLHEFHYALRRSAETGEVTRHHLPHRTTADSLIEGNHEQVVAFLDSLTYSGESTPEVRAVADAWREQAQAMERRRGNGSRTAQSESAPAND